VVTEPGVECLKRLFEANLCWVQIAHGGGQPVLGEIARVDIACLCNQLHRAHRGLVVPIGEHVQVGVGHAPAVERPRRLREVPVGQTTLVHQRAERLSEWLIARLLHHCLPIVPSVA
jgi:hypothetical protein